MIICVTGPMAAGKNTVCSILEQYGWLSIDADKTVHKILEDKKVIQKILTEFTNEAKKNNLRLTNEDGSINRRNLGALLFSNKKLLKRHESIIHPEVDKLLSNYIEENINKNIILNATVLYKCPVINRCEKILYVTSPIFSRLKRAKKRDGIKTKFILARFFAQRKLFTKYKKSDADIYIIKNTGDINFLEKQLKDFIVTA